MKRAVVAVVAASAAFGAASMKWGMDYEAQMSNVQAVSRVTAEEMAALSEKAKQLGRDSAFTASQTGEAMEFLVMAGFKPVEILAAVGDTLNLAAAGSLDLASAADIASNVLTGFNLKAEEMGRVADVMAETAASSNTNILQLGEAMSYVAPQAAAAGWSLDETAAAIGMLGNVGIQGSMAGTVLRGAINGLLNPSDEAYKAMRNLGISVEDSSGRMLSLEEILKQVDPAVLDTAEGLGELTKVFGTRVTPGIVSLIKQGTDNLGEFKTQFEGSAGAAERMAGVKLDNLKGSLTLLKSSFEGLGIALVTGGENSIVGGLQAFVSDGIIPALNATTQWIEQKGGLPGLFSLAWEIVTTFATDVKDSFIALGDWETFKEFVGAFGSALIVGIGLFSEFLLEIVGALIKVASTLWLPIIAPFSVVVSQMRELFMLFINWLDDRFVNAVNKIVEPFRWVMKKVGVEIGKLDWTPLTVESALEMSETWAVSFQGIKDSFGEASDRMKIKTAELGENMKLVGGVMKEAIIDVNPEFDNSGKKYSEKFFTEIEQDYRLRCALICFSGILDGQQRAELCFIDRKAT